MHLLIYVSVKSFFSVNELINDHFIQTLSDVCAEMPHAFKSQARLHCPVASFKVAKGRNHLPVFIKRQWQRESRCCHFNSHAD